MTNDVRPRRDVERNHAAILTAAIAVLADAPQATMADIATASGTGRSTLYRHFPDRRTLIAAIYERIMAEAEAIVAGWLPGGTDDDPIEVMVGLCNALAAIGDRYRFLEQFQTEHRVKNPDDTRHIEEMFVGFLAARQQAGQIRTDLPTEWLMAMIGAVIPEASKRHSESERLDVVGPTLRSLLMPLPS